MNVFTYDTMYRAWMKDEEIGHWLGKPVYAILQDEIIDTAISGVYYIVFDDENKIVGYDNNRVMKHYGYIDSRGAVTELRCPERYFYAEKQPEPKYETKNLEPQPQPQPQAKAENSYEPIVADVRLDNAVEEMLAAARDLTVDSLLDGFNYGLD